MLPKFKILLLLAMIIAESWPASTAPPIEVSTSTAPPIAQNPLEKLLVQLKSSEKDFQEALRTAPFLLNTIISDFGSKLMNALVSDPEIAKGNIVVSPFSIHAAMMMAFFAATIGSQSRIQMAKALCVRDNTFDTTILLLNYYKVLKHYKRPITGIAVANRIFLQEQFPIHPTYNTFMEGFFGAKAETFLPDPVKQINNYVDQATKGMIGKLMKPDSITGQTDMVLVDAISHTGMWKIKFDVKDTKPMTFYTHDGQKIIYPDGMRLMDKGLRYAETLFSTVLELAYEDPDTKMFISIPKENNEDYLNEAAKEFNYQKVERELKCNKEGIEVTMPRFKATFRRDLVSTMYQLGITDLFDSWNANLLYLTQQILGVTEIIHETTVEVKEDGSKSAAATAAVLCTRDSFGPKAITVNWPFVLNIVDIRHGITLFKGIILNPEVIPDGNGASP